MNSPSWLIDRAGAAVLFTQWKFPRVKVVTRPGSCEDGLSGRAMIVLRGAEYSSTRNKTCARLKLVRNERLCARLSD